MDRTCEKGASRWCNSSRQPVQMRSRTPWMLVSPTQAEVDRSHPRSSRRVRAWKGSRFTRVGSLFQETLFTLAVAEGPQEDGIGGGEGGWGGMLKG